MELRKGWDIEETCAALMKGVVKNYMRGVDGDVAEFGTFTGRTAIALSAGIANAEAIYGNKLTRLGLSGDGTKSIHLFDSFEGLPEISDENDKACPLYSSGLWVKGSFNADLARMNPDNLRMNCEQLLPKERVNIYKGWFSDTIPLIDPGLKLSLIHIDCDLYSSTMDVLEGLINGDHIQSGALIFFDDWDCNAASPDFGERKAWADLVKKYSIRFSPEQNYGAFGYSVIFHSAQKA